MTLGDHADAYRQVKEAWKDATEARQITMLDDLQDLLDGIGFDDDGEYELRGRVERLISGIEDEMGIDDPSRKQSWFDESWLQGAVSSPDR